MKSYYLTLGLVAGCLALSTGNASAAVALISASGPTATYGTTVNFTATGTYDWVYYAGATRGLLSYDGNELKDMNLFSPLTLVTSTAGVVLSGGGYTAAQGATIVYTNGSNPENNGAGNSSNTYARGAAIGDGLAFTFTLAGHTTVAINVYAQNYNVLPKLTLVSAASGQLYADSAPVGLPSGDSTNGAGSGHGAGVYQFIVSNDSDDSDTLSFSYIMAATNGGSSSVGLQGVTVAVVPEVATVGIMGLGAAGLLIRRRR